jgi:hypothetical protein
MTKKNRNRKAVWIEPVDEKDIINGAVEVDEEPTVEDPQEEVKPEEVKPVEQAKPESTEEPKPEEEKSFISKLKEYIPLLEKVKEMFTPKKPVNYKSSLTVFKDVKGQYHAVGMVTNKWRDRDAASNPQNGGEILTEAAHKEYMSFLDSHPEEAPNLVAWHEKKTATKAKAEFWDYLDGFVIMSWPLEDKEAEGIVKAEKAFGPLGMSHEFVPEQKDTKAGLIHKYRSTEATHLPLNYAANLFTDIAVARTEVKDMGKFADAKRKYFVEIYGEDVTANLEKEAESRAKSLTEQGVQAKDYEAENPVTKALEVIAEGLSTIKASQTKAEEEVKSNYGKIDEAMKSLGSRLDKVEKSDDEKISSVIRPKLSEVMQVKEGAQGEVISEEEAKEKAPKAPQYSWLTDAHQNVHG